MGNTVYFLHFLDHGENSGQIHLQIMLQCGAILKSTPLLQSENEMDSQKLRPFGV